MQGLKSVFFLLILMSSLIAVPASAADEAGSELASLIEKLDREIQALQLLVKQTEQTEILDRQALVFRQDDRTFKLLADADELAAALAELPESSEVRAEQVAKLAEELRNTDQRVYQRLDELAHQIADVKTKLADLGTGVRISTEAHLQSLEATRFQYYESLIGHYKSRQLLGLDFEESLQRLTSMIHLHAEALAGQAEFDGAARDDVESRLGRDPTNTDLQGALSSLNISHNEVLGHLAKAIDLLDSLEVDSTTYKALMLQQNRGISVGLFQSGVINQLAGTWWGKIKEALEENAPNFLLNMAIFLIVLVLFRSLSKLTRRVVRASCDRSSLNMSVLLKDILVSASGGAVMTLGILMALSQVGISLGPMLAGLGVAGFVIGFALQDTLGNFAAGAMILIYRPYDVDDFIEVSGAAGLVKKMSLVSTTIVTFDNQTLVIPNSKIWGDVIKNVTAQQVRRVDMEFGIGYQDDIEKAERVLADILDSHAGVLKKPGALIKVNSLGESSVNIAVRPWTKTEDYWDVYWDVTREVKLRFDREGIAIPFPQRDVHFYQESSIPNQPLS